MWTENYGGVEAKAGEAKESAGFGKALSEGAAKIFGDRRILLTGLVQVRPALLCAYARRLVLTTCVFRAIKALFEGAMYIFVLQWPPALQAILGGHAGGVPFGTVFSCLLTSCMVGSSAFSLLLKYGIRVRDRLPPPLSLAVRTKVTAPTLPVPPKQKQKQIQKQQGLTGQGHLLVSAKPRRVLGLDANIALLPSSSYPDRGGAG